MKLNYQPKSNLEKFGLKVQKILVENFPDSYIVGGMVRDFLVGKKITDIDIATSATPIEVVDQMKKYFVECNVGFQEMGVVIASEGEYSIAITTFRKDLPSEGRYPQVSFTKSAKVDARRRDFTVNALYFEPNRGTVLDFYNGLKDIKKKQLKFIGTPKKRIEEDPLRIVRALRFSLALNFTLEPKTFAAIKNQFNLTSTLTSSRIEKEINKLDDAKQKNILKEVINNPQALDKYF